MGCGHNEPIGNKSTTALPQYLVAGDVSDGGHVRELFGSCFRTAHDQFFRRDGAERDVDRLTVAYEDWRIHQGVHLLCIHWAHCEWRTIF